MCQKVVTSQKRGCNRSFFYKCLTIVHYIYTISLNQLSLYIIKGVILFNNKHTVKNPFTKTLNNFRHNKTCADHIEWIAFMLCVYFVWLFFFLLNFRCNKTMVVENALDQFHLYWAGKLYRCTKVFVCLFFLPWKL